MLKEIIKELLFLKKQSTTLIYQIIQQKNQLSYLTPLQLSNINNSIPSFIMMNQIYDELPSSISQLNETHDQMLKLISKYNEIMLNNLDEIEIDSLLAQEIIHSFQQQYLLETTLKDQLFLDNTDEDTIKTILACYSRSPYTSKLDFSMILNDS